MLSYIIRRLFYMIIILLIVSVVSFIIIQLPPGDYLTSFVNNLKASGIRFTEEQLQALEQQYGLNLPIYLQYLKWMWNMLHGDFGRSFQWNESVS